METGLVKRFFLISQLQSQRNRKGNRNRNRNNIALLLRYRRKAPPYSRVLRRNRVSWPGRDVSKVSREWISYS